MIQREIISKVIKNAKLCWLGYKEIVYSFALNEMTSHKFHSRSQISFYDTMMQLALLLLKTSMDKELKSTGHALLPR
jgi:hypothetical protein